MYCIVLSMMLSSKGEWIWCFSFRNRQACGHHVPPSAENGRLPSSPVRDTTNRSATSIALSKGMSTWRICLCFGPMATQSHTCLRPNPNQDLVNDKSLYFPFPWKCFQGIVFLNPFPDGDMAPYWQICLMPLPCFYGKDPESKGTGNRRYPLAWSFAFDVPIWITGDFQL